MAKLLLGIVTIGTLMALLIGGFVLPEFVNAENKDYMFPLMRHINDISISLLFILLVYYFIFLIITTRIPKNKKYLWAAVLFLGNIFAFPFIWYHYIWKENENT